MVAAARASDAGELYDDDGRDEHLDYDAAQGLGADPAHDTPVDPYYARIKAQAVATGSTAGATPAPARTGAVPVRKPRGLPALRAPPTARPEEVAAEGSEEGWTDETSGC